jgi:hypothetical protein
MELQLGEQDTLIGGAGRDLYILGDKHRVYYSDRNSQTEGATDYGLIKNFDPTQDQIQLKGDYPSGTLRDRSSYSLSFFTSGSSTLANIFYLEPGSTPERVGIIEDVASNLTINSSAFTLVN